MSLPKFAVGMIAVALIIAGWSVFDGHSITTALVRAAISLAVLQAGYFVMVLVLAARLKPDEIGETSGDLDEPKAETQSDEKFSKSKTVLDP